MYHKSSPKLLETSMFQLSFFLETFRLLVGSTFIDFSYWDGNSFELSSFEWCLGVDPCW